MATVLDVGAGIRPMQWYQPARHICVEPYAPYCQVLRTAGYEVWQATAAFALEDPARVRALFDGPIEAIYLLDVIEHMEKADGWAVVRAMRRMATRQIVIYTPFGYKEQTEDHWGYGGHDWQRHRSGWWPTDFPAPEWTTQRFVGSGTVEVPEGFFAVWTSRSTRR